MSPAFRRKLREEIKIPEQPVKHQEHVAELAKRVADMEPHERTLIRLSIDPRYAADGRKTSIIFEPVAIVPKNVDGKNVLQMLRGNSIEDFVDFGGLDNIVGVSGYAYTRTGRKIPIIVKKWEFSPSYPDARELFGLGTIYLAPGNRKALIRGKLGRLTGIQVVGRGLTPDDYLMNMIRLYAEQIIRQEGTADRGKGLLSTERRESYRLV
ncbi:MAG: hypothetical protein PWP76_199 [Candidatus Diapherotrites archaeon]|nr:hypothetical protein [Candidatus Diapherotrites archaeon]MDN5366860.1 hypothetical protein [Candidatus Diapherotrites archaeon]